MASSRGFLNIQSLNELTSENVPYNRQRCGERGGRGRHNVTEG